MQFTSSLQRESAITNRRIASDLAKFREANETCWFDGTPQSIDRRLAACNALITRAQAAAARAPFDAHPLQVLAELDVDRRALAGIREDLLNGGANRVAFYPPEPPQHINEDLKPQWREDVANGVNPMERHLPEKYRTSADLSVQPNPLEGFRPGAPPAPKKPYVPPNYYRDQPLQGPGEWDPEADDWAVPPIKGPNPRSYTPPPGSGNGPAPYQPSTQGIEYNQPGNHGVRVRRSSLDPDEIRYITLEAPKFVRANLDCIYFPTDNPAMHYACGLDEMAIRAQNHIARELSASTNKAAIAEAFVGAVLHTARQLPAPQPVKHAAREDFDGLPDEAMWL